MEIFYDSMIGRKWMSQTDGRIYAPNNKPYNEMQYKCHVCL